MPWTAACQSSLSFTISQSLPKFMFIDSMVPSNHLILSPHSLPSIFPSIKIFSSNSALHVRYSKYWNFSFTSVLPMSIQGGFPLGLMGLISLPSEGLSGVFSSIRVWKHQFFGAQPSWWSSSHIPYITIGKTIALTLHAFVSKVMFLLFNMLPKLVIAFLPKKQTSYNFVAAVTLQVILELKKIHYFHFFHIYLPCSDGTRCHDLSFWKLSFLSQIFHSPLSPSRNSSVPLHLLPSEWYNMNTKVVDVSPGNLDFDLWFIQPGILCDVFCIEVK